MAQKITPFLWFDSQAEEAARFYTSIFDNSEISEVVRYGEAGPGEAGTVMTVAFCLAGQDFVALNGGPVYQFSPATSFVIDCKSQEEVDHFWDNLSEGGEPGPCGWLRDRYGVSWQVVPSRLIELLGDQDRERANRVMQAMLQMGKLEIPKLQEAYEQG